MAWAHWCLTVATGGCRPRTLAAARRAVCLGTQSRGNRQMACLAGTVATSKLWTSHRKTVGKQKRKRKKKKRKRPPAGQQYAWSVQTLIRVLVSMGAFKEPPKSTFSWKEATPQQHPSLALSSAMLVRAEWRLGRIEARPSTPTLGVCVHHVGKEKKWFFGRASCVASLNWKRRDAWDVVACGLGVTRLHNRPARTFAQLLHEP